MSTSASTHTGAVSATDNPGSGAADWTTISVVSIAHGTSHFFQLTLVPLFPWIQAHFSLSYTQLGLALTIFYLEIGRAHV